MEEKKKKGMLILQYCKYPQFVETKGGELWFGQNWKFMWNFCQLLGKKKSMF